jgi:hypothetical protein
MVLLGGCNAERELNARKLNEGAGKGPSDAAKTKPTEPLDKQIANLGPGAADRLTPPQTGVEQRKLWSIQWQSARLLAGDESLETANLQTVAGTLYRNNKPVGTFKSEAGRTDRPEDELELSGKVALYGLENRTRITCKQLVYYPRQNVIKLRGEVRMTAPGMKGDLGEEVWATADLSRVATPREFKR